MNGICLQCGNVYPSLLNKFIKQNSKQGLFSHYPTIRTCSKSHTKTYRGQRSEPKSHNSIKQQKNPHIFEQLQTIESESIRKGYRIE